MEFKNRLTFNESTEMINEVAESVFVTDPETGAVSYLPELYDFAFRLAVARYFAGYQSSGDTAADYETAMNINPSEIPLDQQQLAGITSAIHEKIEMRKAKINQSNITVTSRFDLLAPVLEQLINSAAAKIAALDFSGLNEALHDIDMKSILTQYIDASFSGKFAEKEA